MLAAAMLALLGAPGALHADSDSVTGKLEAQLRAIGERERLRFVGLNRIADAPARAVAEEGPLNERLDRLLNGYNYLLTVDEMGRPATVRILGKRTQPAEPAARSPVTIITVRRGRHHLVPATLIGYNGATTQALLLLDTGASTVVLPQSQAAPLGFTDDKLTDGVARTAAGTITVRLGQLSQVQVGAARAADIAVAFVDDALLGDGSLLGMSFLEHFDMRLEDGHDRLTLRER